MLSPERLPLFLFADLLRPDEDAAAGDCEPYGRGRKVQSRSLPLEQVLPAAAELLNNE